MNDTATDLWPRRVAILGVGLLGGSVAMSIRRTLPDTVFVGYSRGLDRLADAVQRGLIDVATDSVEQACAGCDVVVVATPVDRIAAMAVTAAAATAADTLITDVGSTKAGIVAAVESDPIARRKFVAAHPIAGSEKSGARYAQAGLFDQKVIVLTPGDSAGDAIREKADRFWKLVGGQTITMTADEHDAHLAAVSHVPHLVSALVARMVPPEARSLVGSGWSDITRVAAGDPEMWTAICHENRAAVLSELDRLRDELDRLRETIGAADDAGLTQWLDEAKRIKEDRR
ncbi:prephenate dehydrogenase [Rubripirellula lacrimiformis]|uniref:Prephenate dehydrogenase n=2 Tax=Rubripirellula lacrimiformis TaxID=1930273 RepID=A0A517NL67_9BACT|nr:prephenate dehydrogenase [Rubripirellula lacrimiformis]